MTHKAATGNAIDYDHSQNLHSTDDARAALDVVFPGGVPASILDVGCGTGTWLRTIAQAGVTDYLGVDGVDIPANELLIERDHFIQMNIATEWDLGRRFAAALCLEVAEHLPPENAGTLIDALARHSDLIVFSAACPGQPGQHHVNCQWPSYWQALFNVRGYVCNDEVRWRLWDNEGVDPWYKQNMFIARRAPGAGSEPRLRPVVHPEMIPCISAEVAVQTLDAEATELSHGYRSMGWYLNILAHALAAKARRKLARLFGSDKNDPA
jgi:SAM-dependent methyltransferase